jgi:small subunit ribosomal protein S1
VAEARKSEAQTDQGDGGHETSTRSPEPEAQGTLASDEALAALRDKLSGGQS